MTSGNSGGPLTPERLGTIVAAATGLIGGIAALTLTGALGRVQRNHGGWFAAAVTAVLAGATIVALATLIDAKYQVLPRPTWWRRRLCRAAAVLVVAGAGFFILFIALSHPGVGLAIAGGVLLAAGVTTFLIGVIYGAPRLKVSWRETVQVFGAMVLASGIVIAFIFAISSADEIEQPEVTLAFNSNASSVSGTVKVGDLSSRDRLNVFVDGLVRNGKRYKSTQLYKAFVGPDSNGDASDKITVPIAADTFDAVGISAYTTRNPAGCGRYPTGKAGQTEGTGCAVIQLPAQGMSPELSASLSGAATEVLNIRIKANVAKLSPRGGSVLLRVGGATRRGPTTLYSAILTPSTDTLSQVIEVPVLPGLSLICVEARLMPADAKTSLAATCPLKNARVGPGRSWTTGTAIVELRPRGMTRASVADAG